MTRTYAPADMAAVAAYAAGLSTARAAAERALPTDAPLVSTDWIMRNIVVGLHEYAARGMADLAEASAHEGHLVRTAGRHAWPAGWCTNPDAHEGDR